ncbi:MAG TPA: FAD binding domain-containing protein [Candidatus Angelobacter sp.]|nr:FAD binding domain-containing protein [Candidatus Angelobacter sp.]
MRPFDYASPTSTKQVSDLLGKSWGEVEILAGGSDLLSLMKDEITTPKRLVNIKGIQELHGIKAGKDELKIGALTTLTEIAMSKDVQALYPVLAAAAGEAASPQIRNVATIGGNLCQRPRCWYFRSGHGLLAQKDSKSLVLQGDNRYHAILGNNGPAYFVSPSTVAPVLIAYSASVSIQGPRGERELPLEKFFIIPQQEGEREHDLKPDEIVTGVKLVSTGARPRAAHYEVRQKEAFDWPYATAAVALNMNGSTVQSARVVLGHVAPIPWLSQEAAQALQGKAITPATADEAAKAALASAKSLGHNTQKVHLAQVAVKRAILQAAGSPARAAIERNGIEGGAA